MIDFIRRNARWIAGGFLLTYASSFGQTFFVSQSVGEWQEKFGLSHGGFGGLYFIATMASALTLPWLGRLVDLMPQARAIMVCMPILALATILVAYAPSILVLTAGIYLLRLFGQGMMTHIALTATGKWFAASRGRAVSLVVLGHQGGEATLPLIFAAVSVAVGWQAGWLLGTVLLLLVFLPLAAWAFRVPRIPEGTAKGVTSDARDWTRAEVIRDPIFYVLLLGVLAPPFIGTTIFFHQDYLTDFRGWPDALFAQGFAVMAATTVTIALVNGQVIDRFSAKAVLPFFLLPLAAACFAAAALPSASGLFIFMLLLGVSYGISSTLFGALWPEVYGTEHLGAVRSLIVSAMVLATAAGPGLTGLLIDGGIALPTQLVALGGYCLLAAGAMALCSGRLRARAAA